MNKKLIGNYYNLQLFAGVLNTNVTTDGGMTPEMKTFYDKDIIDNAQAYLVHDQFAQKKNIPANKGKIIEFRKYDPLPKSLTPLTEGVTPDGKKITVTTITAQVAQYGDYVAISDVLDMTAIDDNLLEANKLLGVQAGETLDTITREVINGGTSVIYSGSKTARNLLTATDALKVLDIKKAERFLKVQKAKKINGSYVGIIHPDVAFDLKNDPEFIEWHKYASPDELYEGEIGKISGVRFVETTEAKIWAQAGASSISVYSTLILGENAYATTALENGGLEMIVKQKGSAGTADPLNQRATAGWKATKTAEILTQTFMLRIESGSSFSTTGAGAAN